LRRGLLKPGYFPRSGNGLPEVPRRKNHRAATPPRVNLPLSWDVFLHDEPIHARPSGHSDGSVVGVAANRRLAASVGVGTLLLLIVLIVCPIALLRINNARIRAESAEHRIEAQLYTALLGQARATVRSGEVGQRIRTLEGAPGCGCDLEHHRLRREALAALALPDLRFGPRTVDWEQLHDGRAGSDVRTTGDRRGTNSIEIRSVADQRLLVLLPAASPDRPTAGRWSADGRFFAVRLAQLLQLVSIVVEIWELPTGRRILQLPSTQWGACALHPRLPLALADNGDGTLRSWNLETSQARWRLQSLARLHHVEFSPDGRSFLVQHRIGAPWYMSLHDAKSGALLRTSLRGGSMALRGPGMIAGWRLPQGLARFHFARSADRQNNCSRPAQARGSHGGVYGRWRFSLHRRR
jgi:hypothetical protein